MQITQHFSLEEFCATQHRGINNMLPDALFEHARQTCEMLERIREYLSQKAQRDVPITLSSGYRCLPLNKAVGSSDTSDHVQAWAADWTAPAYGTPYTISLALSAVVNQLEIGQLIHEFGRWVHVGVPKPPKAYNRIITLDKNGTQVGIQRIV